MEYPYIDIHTHSLAEEAGVVKIYSYLMGSGEALPSVPFSAGVHPWSVINANPGILGHFPRGDKNLVAVGEIGLDYAVVNLDKAKQIEWFERQLALAEELKLPVVIHCVKAYNDVTAMVKKRKLKAVIIHSFIGSVELAGQLVESGIFLSFGVNSLRSHRTVEALKVIPTDKILLETDDSGDSIAGVYEKVAGERGMEVNLLKERLYENYKKIFG